MIWVTRARPKTDRITVRARIPLLVVLLAVTACGTGGGAPSNLPLSFVRDVAMPGPAVRFDSQDVDPDARRLYIAHLGAGDVDVVDLDALQPVGTVPDVAEVHGAPTTCSSRSKTSTATRSCG